MEWLLLACSFLLSWILLEINKVNQNLINNTNLLESIINYNDEVEELKQLIHAGHEQVKEYFDSIGIDIEKDFPLESQNGKNCQNGNSCHRKINDSGEFINPIQRMMDGDI